MSNLSKQEKGPLVFDTPKACIADLEAKVWKKPYGSGRRRAGQQVQCQACKRWKYSDERCNLFTTAKVDYE